MADRWMEARVMDNSRVVAATLVAAVLGAMAGYVLFTERGRAWRRQFEPALDDLARELAEFRGTVAKAAGVASESWRLLNDAVGERERERGGRYTTPHQTSPF